MNHHPLNNDCDRFKGKIIELAPGEGAPEALAKMRAAVLAEDRPQALAHSLEELRELVAGRIALARSSYSDQCVARLLAHVDELHTTIRELAELTAVDGLGFLFNQAEITRTVHKQLATFAPPKA
jgi:hypothetical protein